MARPLSLPMSAISLLLTFSMQTNSYYLHHSAHPRNSCPSRGLCSLLQTFPTICSNTRLCNPPCHISRTNSRTRSLFLNPSGIDHHTLLCAVRSLILLFPPQRWESGREHTASTPDPRRNRILFLAHPPTEILATPSTNTVPQFSSVERTFGYRVQCRAYSGWDDMAHSTWIGVYSLCSRLESGPRECLSWRGMAWRSWCRWSRSHRATTKTYSVDLQQQRRGEGSFVRWKGKTGRIAGGYDQIGC